MGVADLLKEGIERLVGVHREYVEIQVRVGDLRDDVKELVKEVKESIIAMNTDLDLLRRRVSELEGRLDATLKGAVTEAALRVLREGSETPGDRSAANRAGERVAPRRRRLNKQ